MKISYIVLSQYIVIILLNNQFCNKHIIQKKQLSVNRRDECENREKYFNRLFT